MSSDQYSFDEIYRAYYHSLLKVVKHKISSREMAEDVLQEAFIKIWLALPTYDPARGGIYTWMAKICSHMALDQLNSKSYRKQFITDQLDADTRHLNNRQCLVIDTDQMDVLFHVRALPKLYAEPLMLSGMGYSHTDIASILMLPLGTVKSRIRAALMILRKRWAFELEQQV